MQMNALEKVKSKTLGWFGLIERMEKERLTRELGGKKKQTDNEVEEWGEGAYD